MPDFLCFPGSGTCKYDLHSRSAPSPFSLLALSFWMFTRLEHNPGHPLLADLTREASVDKGAFSIGRTTGNKITHLQPNKMAWRGGETAAPSHPAAHPSRPWAPVRPTPLPGTPSHSSGITPGEPLFRGPGVRM